MHPEAGPPRGADPEQRLREAFAEGARRLARQAAEDMPQDLDALFAGREPDPGIEEALRHSFVGDLEGAAPSPAHLDRTRAAELDRRLGERLRRPEPVPAEVLRHPSWARRVGPWVAGLAAAAVLALLILKDRQPEPLFVVVDSEQPLTGQDPRLVSLWAAGAVADLPGSLGALDQAPVREPKKGGE
ncbi:MAG: hypothetical protein R3F30_01095 [Planctomycetota bacterium]